MAGIFVQGETKVRPGVYTRYESGGIQTTGSLLSGIGACVFRSSFGPLNEIAELYSPGEAHDLFGDGGTSDVIDELFFGGASSVIAVRANTGGTATAITLKDSLDAGVVTITAKYVGARAFAVTIRDSLVNAAMRELTIYEPMHTSLPLLTWRSRQPQKSRDVMGLNR